MGKQAGLADSERFEAFSQQWRDTIVREARKWCTDEKAVQLLADAVLADFQRKYANIDVPRNLEYFFKAQVCLVYSTTGQNIRKLKYYIAEHSLPLEDKLPFETNIQPEPPTVQMQPAPVEAEPVPSAVSVPVTVLLDEPAEDGTPDSAMPQEAVEPVTVLLEPPAEDGAPAPEAAPQATSEPAPVPPDKPAADSTPAPAAPQATAEADTFLDPVRTTFWTPDSELNEHVVEEMELPDEEEDERSVILSFMNVVLFLMMTGAFAFCVYETGLIQYLLQ